MRPFHWPRFPLQFSITRRRNPNLNQSSHNSNNLLPMSKIASLTTRSQKPKLGFGSAILQLLMLGLASPFLEMQDPLHGIIGLIILLVGIRIAWQITAGTRRAKIEGPYENSSAAAI